MPSQQALSTCREGILFYLSNFQYPLRSEPMRSITPAPLSIFNLSDTVFRLRDRFSARKVVVYAGSTARRFRIFSDVSSSVSVTLSVTFSVTLPVTELSLIHISTPKLDAKIEKLKGEMQSTLKLAPASTPSDSKFTNYKKVSKSPMQGGSFTPK